MIEYEKKVQNLLQDSFRFCLSRCQDEQIAEEVSAQSIYHYLLKEQEIQSPRQWIISTTNNRLNDYYRKNKLVSSIDNSQELKLSEQFEKTCAEFIVELQSFIPDNELELLKKYYTKNSNKDQIAEENGISTVNLRKKISLLKQKTIALINLKKGYLTGNYLILPELNSKMTSFLRALGKSIKNNNIDNLTKYLSEVGKNKIDNLKSIKKIVGFDYKKHKDFHEFHLLNFHSEGQLKAIGIHIKIKNNFLKVIDIVDDYKSVTMIKSEKDTTILKKIMKKSVRNSTGQLCIDSVLVRKIRDKNGDEPQNTNDLIL